jgi:hypothetical protein
VNPFVGSAASLRRAGPSFNDWERDENAEDADESKATAACQKQKSENASKFAQDYEHFGQCVNMMREVVA